MQIISTVCEVYASVVLAKVLDAAIEKDFSLLSKLLLFMLTLYGIMLIFEGLHRLCANSLKEGSLNTYRNHIANIIRSKKEKIDIDTNISSLTNDAVQVELAIDNFITMMNAGIGMILSFSVLIYVHPYIAILSSIIFLLNSIIPRLLNKRIEKVQIAMSDAQKTYYSKITNDINGYDVWNLYNAKKILKNNLKNSNENLEKEKRNLRNTSDILTLFPIFGSLTGQIIQMIFTFYLIVSGKLNIGAFATTGNITGKFSNSTSQFFSSIMKISGYNAVINEKMSGIKEIDENLKEINSYDLSVNNLSFSYGDKKIFDNLNLNFENGKKYAIIGSSGSGKSTLSNILTKKIKDYEGKICFGKEDYDNLNDYTIHNYIGFMTQKPYIFNYSYIDNITLGKDLEKENVKRAILDSRVDEFASDMNEMIENNGENISGGQAQRIAIAREIVNEHKIIIFDEAINALDKRLVNEIVNMLLSKDMTIIFIAHNLDDELLKKFDKIINLDEISMVNS